MFLNEGLFWMNYKTSIELGFRILWRIMEISDGVIRRGRTISIILHIVRGHVSEKSFSWAFYEHFSFFTETYSLNGIESTKRCLQFFESYVGLFYAN